VAAFGGEQIQNGGRCHGNQGAKHFKFTSNYVVPIQFHQFLFGE
jgi:hypothetical protein